MEQTPLASTRRQSSAVSAWTPNGAEPAQNHQTFAVNPKKPSSSPKYIDYIIVRKNLFPSQAPPPPTHDPLVQENPQSVPATSKEYQRKEDDLWSKIFSTS